MKRVFTYSLLLVLFTNTLALFAQQKTENIGILEPLPEIFNPVENKNSTGVSLLYDIDLPYNGIIEIEYDSVREGLWLAREDDGIIYLVDLPDGNIIMEVDAASIGLVPDGKFEGIEVLANGNILLSDLQGDNTGEPPIIKNYLLEINPDEGTLVNYWPTTGEWNTSTDGSDIGYTLGLSVGDNGNIYLSSGNGDYVLYEISTTPGLPGTWETVALHPIPDYINVVGVDHYGNYWGLTDWWSNTVFILDENFDSVFTFIPTHYGVDFNFGITFIESQEESEPLTIAVHTAFGRIGFYVKDPCSSINCSENQEVVAGESGYYSIIGNELDALIVDTCGMGISYVHNDFNDLESLEGAQLPIGETTVNWTFTDDFGNTQTCTSTIVVDIYDGITKLTNTNISIYPNPTSGVITVSSETLELESIEITDISGKMVYSKYIGKHTATIDLSNQPSGVYFVKFQTKQGVIIKKLFKD